MKFVPSPGEGRPATFVPDASPSPAPQPQPRDKSYTRKGERQPHDTPTGCRDQARGSAALAEASANPNVRAKYVQSAATWTARADMLQRLDDSHAARLALAAARV
ncbi:MAG: hypothetical protein ACK4SZ_05055 [Allosphingosinicella sp.]|uniref:hypothetical protein n=1 Tax=Allosphingosinicella sp. TaxID=2823234 RepID=UPI0039408500